MGIRGDTHVLPPEGHQETLTLTDSLAGTCRSPSDTPKVLATHMDVSAAAGYSEVEGMHRIPALRT